MSKDILLAHWNGRFGNRMHQYAYGKTYAKKNACDFILPSTWEGTFLFKEKCTISDNDDLRLHINQSQKALDNIEYRTQNIKKHYSNARRINPEDDNDCYCTHDDLVFFDCMCAYRQAVFNSMSKAHLKSVFEFSDEVKSLDIYKRLEDNQGKDTVAHLRRDDICNLAVTKTGDVGYSTISLDSYKKAFDKYGFDFNEVNWVTDDRILNVVPKKQEVKLGWSYPVGAEKNDVIGFDFLEDFLKIYFAKTVFRANSSFSWWASFLSDATIYSPVLKEKVVYGYPDLVEIDVDFTEGNENHWMHYCEKIIIPD